MKERLKKIIKIASVILTIICIISLIYTVVFNLRDNYPCFFKTNVSEIVTIIIAVVFAYYYVELRNDGRKQKEIIENNVRKIQKYIYDKEIYEVSSKEIANSLTRSIKIRKIKNLITFLNNYSKKFNFESEFKEISKNFKEYQLLTETMAQDDDFSSKSKNHVVRTIETLDDNLEELVHKIYI